MKKWLLSILALIVIAGATVPCCADDALTETAIHSHEKDHHDEGGCSPFFACASCPGFIQLLKSISIDLPPDETTIYFETPTVYQTASFCDPVFQPPKKDLRFF